MAKQCDEIDYRLIGEEMQAVVVTLDPDEQVIAEAGGMLYMLDGIEMQTAMSTDRKKGFLGNLMKAAGRMLTGESFFITTFTNAGGGRSDVAFAAPYPGKITPLDMSQHGNEMICQKDSFLCAARGTEVSIAFQKKIGVGLFGGEGFILQRLKGDGFAFIHAGGSVFHMDLKPGEKVRVDSGCIVAFEATVTYDIQFVGGFKNALFGGEGLFIAVLSGPGRVFLQTLPFSRLADRLVSASKLGGGTRRDEGSMLGGLFTGDDS
jgi:uncharacterized protein (TIGR00266 family)